MKRFPLRRVQYYEEYADEIGIDRVVDPADYYKVLPPDEITLEELIEWLSREAMDVNYCYRHAGTAERLAELITKHGDKKNRLCGASGHRGDLRRYSQNLTRDCDP